MSHLCDVPIHIQADAMHLYLHTRAYMHACMHACMQLHGCIHTLCYLSVAITIALVLGIAIWCVMRKIFVRMYAYTHVRADNNIKVSNY